jgi:phytoene dehydrogenase-like protein
VPDAVVIGAGHNGLVAGNVLADAGWDVVVCEATPHAGGAVRSDESAHPGYVTDLFSAFYPLGAASPALAALDLGAHGLRWSHAPAVLAHLLPDDRAVLLHRDREGTMQSLEQFGAGDGEAWRKLVEQFDALRGPALQALFRPFPPVGPALRLFRTLGSAEALRLARFALTPVRRAGEERFRGVGGTLLLAGNALHTDLPPEGAGSAIYGWILAMLGQTVGFPVPVGGSSALIDALVRRLESRGGQLRLNAPVERIEIGRSGARGVRLAGGEYLVARRAVVADVVAPALYRSLVGLDRLPPRIAADLDMFEWDMATLKVNWAVDTKIPWKNPEVGQAGTVHLGVDLDGLTRYAADLATKTMPEQPFILLGQMTTSDSTRSPEGTESAWAYTHLPARRSYDADEIDVHVQRMEQTVERHAPGFLDHVVGRHVQSPHELQEDDPNLVNGAVNGGTASLHQQLIFRPIPGLARPETPVDRLYLASASAHPGGGVHGAPGWNAAHVALGRDRLYGRARAGLLRGVHARLYDRS